MLSAMRRHASEWSVLVSSEISNMPCAEDVGEPEGNSARDDMARSERSGGVEDDGTFEEDGPGTWEACVSPRSPRRNREPVTRP